MTNLLHAFGTFKSRDDWDRVILEHVDHFSVTEFLGAGKYDRTDVLSLQKAREVKARILSTRPRARILIYAVAGTHSALVE